MAATGALALLGVGVCLAAVSLLNDSDRADTVTAAADGGETSAGETPIAPADRDGNATSAEGPQGGAPDDPAWDELMEQRASGWTPYQGYVIGTETDSPLGYIPTDFEPEKPDLRTPIFDAPGGNVIGYHYTRLGFLPLAESETFDAPAARVEEFGCDVELDLECMRAYVENSGG